MFASIAVKIPTVKFAISDAVVIRTALKMAVP
jgi:hypothetical protein